MSDDLKLAVELNGKLIDANKEIVRLKRIIAKELTENDELGAEYTYVLVLKEQVEQLKGELEYERLRLAACGVAAMQNTEATRCECIDRANKYWSASYGDVCRAVDSEIALRTKLQIATEALEKIVSMKDMTRLADCCVDKSCHINVDSNSCSFQTGVHYGNADRAADAQEALAKLKGDAE